MFLRFPEALVRRLDFVAAVRNELDHPMDALPSRTVDLALREHVVEYAEQVAAQCRAGLQIDIQEMVLMPKAGNVGRYRTLTTLPLRERVLLRALANEISSYLPPVDRSFEANEAFAKRPVEAGLPYVVIADIASFYFNVSHASLASRIVDVVARVDTAEAVVAVLGAVLGRDHGLPQNFEPSDVLSELIVAPIERRVVRRGIVTFRNNDDFRLCSPSWGEALAALEALQQEVNLLGLDLNGEKSRILKLKTYTRNVGLAAQFLADALPADIDLPIVDPYTGELIDPGDDIEEEVDFEVDEGFVEIEAVRGPDNEVVEVVDANNASDVQDESEPDYDEAVAQELADEFGAVFNEIASKRLGEVRELDPFEKIGYRQATTTALAVLSSVRSEAAIERGSELVAVDPLLARQFATYLKVLAAEGTQTSWRVDEVVKRFDRHLPPWVFGWLIDPLLDASAELTDESVAALDSFMAGSASAVLRARALLALSVHSKRSRVEIAKLMDSFPAAARPDIVAAFAVAPQVQQDPELYLVLGDDAVSVWVYAHVSEHGVP